MHNSSMNLSNNPSGRGIRNFQFEKIIEEENRDKVKKEKKKSKKIKPIKKESEIDKISVLLVNDEPM